MTESEWLACTDPQPMLDLLSRRSSERKLRLYACAWARSLWPRMADERSKEAIRIAELVADGLAASHELILAFNAAQAAWREIRLDLGGRHGKWIKSPDWSRSAKAAAEVARNAASPVWGRRSTGSILWRDKASTAFARANILRDLFGPLPFRQVRVDPKWLSWQGGTVSRLAQAAYDERQLPSGMLENARLMVLADALEEAGCDGAEILGHLRGPGPHSRGCWALDALLGKS